MVTFRSFMEDIVMLKLKILFLNDILVFITVGILRGTAILE